MQHGKISTRVTPVQATGRASVYHQFYFFTYTGKGCIGNVAGVGGVDDINIIFFNDSSYKLYRAETQLLTRRTVNYLNAMLNESWNILVFFISNYRDFMTGRSQPGEYF